MRNAASADDVGRGSFTIVHSFEVNDPWSWGIGFDGTSFRVTSGEPLSFGDTTMFWIYDASGTLVDSFIQQDGTHWGCRDLACDGTYTPLPEHGDPAGAAMANTPCGYVLAVLHLDSGRAPSGDRPRPNATREAPDLVRPGASLCQPAASLS